MFRTVGWSTLFECLSIYEERFKLSLQASGSLLPDFQEGDAQALVAYLNVLQKVCGHTCFMWKCNFFFLYGVVLHYASMLSFLLVHTLYIIFLMIFFI